MSVFLSDLYRDTLRQYQLEIIAGQSGLNRIVSSIYIAEDIGNAHFLKGGELVITTGMSSGHSTGWLKPFIVALIEKNTCGLILNVGKYISPADITPDVHALCQKHHFPLLTMPWEIHLSDISQDYWYRIFADRQNSYDLASALKSILRDRALSPYVTELLASQSYLPTDRYCLAVLEFTGDSERRHCISQIQKGAAYCSAAKRTDFISFEYGKQLIFVWHNTDSDLIRSHTDRLFRVCQSISAIERLWIGISENNNDISLLWSLYQQACAALSFAQSKSSSCCSFDDLGCYQLFFSVPDHDILQQYYLKYLRELEAYDQAHDSDYLETLEYYLKYNGHLSAIADAMICHRNTINYRINKIRDILGTDLNDGETKFQLQLALNIRNFLMAFEKKNTP